MLRSPDVMRSSSALMPKRERCFWKAHLFYFGDFFFVLLCFCFFTASQGVRIRVPYVRESRSDTAGQSYKSQQASARICQNVRWVWFSSLHLPATRLSLTTHTCQVVTPKYRICLCVFLVTRPSQCFFVFFVLLTTKAPYVYKSRSIWHSCLSEDMFEVQSIRVRTFWCVSVSMHACVHFLHESAFSLSDTCQPTPTGQL